MKTLKIVKRIIISIIAILYFSFALCMTLLLLNYNKYNVTQFGDKSLIIINEDVSREEYTKGDLVIVESVKLDNISLGDTLFCYKIDSNGTPILEIGNVGDIYLDEESIAFENGEGYSKEFIAGKPVKIYNKVGSFLSIVESQWGFLFIVLVPCFLIFIYEIYALVVEIKYGNDEDYDEDLI